MEVYASLIVENGTHRASKTMSASMESKKGG